MEEITISKTYIKGQIIQIHPIAAFLGIDSGVIKILNIYNVPAEDSECLANAIQFTEDLLSISDPEEDDNLTEYYMDQVWVKYKYLHKRNIDIYKPSDEFFYLPIEVFSNCTTGY